MGTTAYGGKGQGKGKGSTAPFTQFMTPPSPFGEKRHNIGGDIGGDFRGGGGGGVASLSRGQPWEPLSAGKVSEKGLQGPPKA